MGQPPVARPPRERGKAGFVLATVGAAVVALLCGGAVGGGAGFFTTEPEGSETAQPFPDNFPHGDQQYLRGVTVKLVVDEWLKKANDWECESREPREINGRNADVMWCNPPGDASSDMHVTIVYEADDKVREVDATCWEGVGAKPCEALFSTMADTVFVPQESLRGKAADWAAKNGGTERFTVIGDIRLEANLDPNGMRAIPAV